jgi:hypothetical protein
MIKFKEASSHWYARDGTSVHTVPCVSPRNRTRTERPTTLADARKLNLLPSVTTIARLFPADGLQNWKQEQIIMSALTTPRMPGDTDESFVKEVIRCAQEQASKAAEVGTRRHMLCERWNKAWFGGWENGSISMDGVEPGDVQFCEPYYQWFRDNVKSVLRSEFIVINQVLGYGGKVDLECVLNDGRRCIVDLKNRAKPAVYDSDCIQLAGYAEAMRDQPAQAGTSELPYCISVVLGTKEPSILVREWDINEQIHAYESFALCHELWVRSKDYRP